MNEKEVRRAGVLRRVKAGELRLVSAASMVGLSYRQTKRVWVRYQAEGNRGLVHRSAGRRSNRAKPEKMRERVLRLVREKYGGKVGERFGPTLAAEHLSSEDGLAVNAETLRRWMLETGLWSRERRRKAYRQRRERKAHFGELVQLDGSFEEWLEERGPEGCLMNLVDDATGVTLCRLGEAESTWAAAGVLRAWIERYGIPQALYTDWKNVYVRPPTAKEREQGAVPRTQFGGICARLGIQIVAASSPQAKGRVERNHGTHQDRLIKKLRRKQMADYGQANEFVEREYLPEHNRRFAREAASREDFHRRAPGPVALEAAFHLEQERTISNDWVVRYDNRIFQVQRCGRYAPAQGKVMVCQWQDGRLQIRYRGRAVPFQEIAAPAPKPKAAVVSPPRSNRPRKPGPEHPWRRPFKRPRSRWAA